MSNNKPSRQGCPKPNPASGTMPVIGLVGGIGSGKTLVADQFSQMGCAVINVDRLAKQLRDLPQTHQALRQEFGNAIFTQDGHIDEKALAELVFTHPQPEKNSPLARLNAIVHPLVVAKCRQIIEQYRQQGGPKALILDAPLLFEAGLEDCCEAVIFVASDPHTRSRRVQDERGWTEEIWAQREKKQISLDKKLEMSDHVVDNNSSKTDLRCHLQRLFPRILGKTSSIQRSVRPSEAPSQQQGVDIDDPANDTGRRLKNSNIHENQEKDKGS